MLFNEPKLLKSSAASPSTPRPEVSVLFNEPKLLKPHKTRNYFRCQLGFSALQRAEIAEIACCDGRGRFGDGVSVLFNEPKLLKYRRAAAQRSDYLVSVLFNEPKLLKLSALNHSANNANVSVLFNEPKLLKSPSPRSSSAL